VSRPGLILLAPLAGWSTPLDEVPDAVFAGRMLGQGVAIDPTGSSLHAPCAAQVTVLPASRHAVTLRTPDGCDILIHVGLETVALAGAGFEAHVRVGQQVRAGEPLLSFDLDFIAQRAPSLLTPVIVTAEGGARIVRCSLDRELAVGEFLMEVAVEREVPAELAADAPAFGIVRRRLTVAFEHGLHARPAALLAASLKSLAADVRIAARGREANARSTVALMALGVGRGEPIEIRASGPDAQAAVRALSAVLDVPATPAAATPAIPATAATLATPATAEPLSAREPSASPVRAPASAASQAVASAALHAGAGVGRGTLVGAVASGGFAVGTALQLKRPEIEVSETGVGATVETAALDRARAALRLRLERRAGAGRAAGAGESFAAQLAGSEAEATSRGIAAAHLELLDDPELLAAARAAIARGKSAAFAWRAAVRESAATLAALPDERLRERVADLLDLESQVLLALAGEAAAGAPPLPADAIVIARELLPSQLAALDATRLAGICMAAGGPTSHAAILAAAMGIPALVALGQEVLGVADGTTLLLDASEGLLEVAPGPARLAAARAEVHARRARQAALEAAARRECRTADGVRIAVFANIGSLAEAQAAVRNGAEGCGLLRTEFLFLDRQLPPTEAEQCETYTRIAEALGERPLTIRTLDAGGDKPIPYLPLPPEENPALGLRGIRTSLAQPQLLLTQLRAVLRVRSPHCRLLLPMITDVEEIAAVRALLDEARRELAAGASPEIGVMVETPAAALLAEQLAASADFLSIGTNDLTQYTLAMDRGNPQLAARLDALHPAVLRLIARTAEAAGARGRHAAVCGGLASEPLAAPLLVGLGVHELSAVPAVIPALKARIGAVNLKDCRELAQQALGAASAGAVRALLARAPGAASVSGGPP
jgi:multiphosphoryl transfer protein